MKRSHLSLRQNWHYLLILFVPVYLTCFVLLEHFVTDNYWVSYCPLDDRIPFVPVFVIPYVLWFPYLFGTGLYLLVRDVPCFRRYLYFMMAALSSCLLFCALFPNGQDLRPTSFERDTIWTWAVGFIYAHDTNTNSIPSMHVVGALGATFAVFDSAKLRRWRCPAVILCVLVCAATVLIKQHSILDTLAGLAVSLVFGLLIYHKRLRKKGSAVT
jgi:membrane-associated phospholipid phosphatase